VPFAHRFYTARPPGILDVPLEMKAAYVDEPDPQTPVGAKGIGEPPVGAGEGAVLCAIQDAMGDAIFQRTPIMTDMILNTIEGVPDPVGALTAHA
jgi:CO/xanthine dehydrogenase Mo-binding subunit